MSHIRSMDDKSVAPRVRCVNAQLSDSTSPCCFQLDLVCIYECCCSGSDDGSTPSKVPRVPSRIVPVSRPEGNDNSSMPSLWFSSVCGSVYIPFVVHSIRTHSETLDVIVCAH